MVERAVKLLSSSHTKRRYRVFTWLGLKDILRGVRKAETLTGKLLHLWHVLYDGELCQRCGRRYDDFIWWCESNELWHSITGKGAAGLYCPSCFDAKARAHGIMFFWTPRLEPEVRFEPEWSSAS